MIMYVGEFVKNRCDSRGLYIILTGQVEGKISTCGKQMTSEKDRRKRVLRRDGGYNSFVTMSVLVWHQLLIAKIRVAHREGICDS